MIFSARVHPRSSRNRVEARPDGSAEVWTTAPAIEGKANDAVCRIVADWLGVPVSSVRILSGSRGRVKRIEAEGALELPA